MEEIIQIRNLTIKFYTYNGVVQALNALDFDIKKKETFGLVGETGCGKTLTALSILRLIASPGHIESGEIYFNPDNSSEPINLLAISDDEIRSLRGSKISMVFQEPSAALNPVYTIGDQISEVILLHRRKELSEKALEEVNNLLENKTGISSWLLKPARIMERGLYRLSRDNPNSLRLRFVGRIPFLRRLLWRFKDEARKVAIETLKEVEIPDPERIFRQHPHQLSGGMKQRAVIATALACSPKFLIADEPTTSLDVTIQAQIMDLVHRLKNEREASILYITHDLAVAAELCDRIGVMYAGSLCEVANAEELFSNPLHPYTKALLEAVPKPGEEPHAIGGFLPDSINPPPGCKFHPRCLNAMPVCSEEIPGLKEISPGHVVACHLY